MTASRSTAGKHLRAFRDAVEAMEDASTPEESEERAAEALHHAIRLDRVADLGRLLAGVAQGFPLVAGRCPTCAAESLFLGAGGHVTCARLDCADPCAADTLLDVPPAMGPACFCGQPDDRERVHRANACEPWSTSASGDSRTPPEAQR